MVRSWGPPILRVNTNYSEHVKCNNRKGPLCHIQTMKAQICLYFHTVWSSLPLRKHAFSNILEILIPKNEKFQIKKSYNFHISVQNIDCGYSLEPPRRGGSNEYPQSMFLARNKKNNVYPCKPQFYYIKVGIKGIKIIEVCFPDDCPFVESFNTVEYINKQTRPWSMVVPLGHTFSFFLL